MPKLNMGEMWPMRGAALGTTWPYHETQWPLGFTWPCLVKMDGGGWRGLVNFYSTGTVTADATQTGTVHCNSPEPTWHTFLWVAILVFLHFALTILLLVWGAVKLYGVKWPKPDKSSKDKKGSMAAPYWPALLVAALPVLSVASFGEIAQHIFDNWLYLGLLPSYYLAVFYSGLVLGSGMLALGIWDNACLLFLLPKGKPSTSVRFAVPASALVVFVLIAGGYNHCNGLARAVASVKNPKLNGASDEFEKCMSDPILLFIVWAPTFVSLFIWTAALFFMNNAKGPKQRTFFIVAVLWLVLGIGSSILVTVTGYQQLHVPTALGFVGLFFTELYFIIYAVPDSYNTGSNQASV